MSKDLNSDVLDPILIESEGGGEHGTGTGIRSGSKGRVDTYV